jgi:ribosomal protein S25
MGEVTRSKSGQFIKGKSGNPHGRPKGSKNRIVEMKNSLEEAIREGLEPDQMKAIVQSMVAEAMNGNVSAGKLILDKVMSNAKANEDDQDEAQEIVIKIENLTPQSLKEVTGTTIDQEDI